MLESSINLTLLKSALAPDMTADRGHQEFTYAFYFWNSPFIESGLVQQGYELNDPVMMVKGNRQAQSLFELDQSNIILDTVKPPEDGSKTDVILRMYESMGTRTIASLKTSLAVEKVYHTDMLEQVTWYGRAR